MEAKVLPSSAQTDWEGLHTFAWNSNFGLKQITSCRICRIPINCNSSWLTRVLATADPPFLGEVYYIYIYKFKKIPSQLDPASVWASHFLTQHHHRSFVPAGPEDTTNSCPCWSTCFCYSRSCKSLFQVSFPPKSSAEKFTTFMWRMMKSESPAKMIRNWWALMSSKLASTSWVVASASSASYPFRN